jgi:hypothetical protein
VTAGKVITLAPGEGFMVPQGVVHRTRAPERCVVLMIEPATINQPGAANKHPGMSVSVSIQLATRRSWRTSAATYTVAIPPAPASRSMRYRSARVVSSWCRSASVTFAWCEAGGHRKCSCPADSMRKPGHRQ